MAFNVEYIYSILDRYTRPLEKIGAAQDKFNKKTDAAGRKVEKLSEKAERAASKFDKLAGAIGGAAIMLGFKKVVDRSVKVEDALADLVRVGGLTTDQVAKMDSAMEALAENLGLDKIGLLQQGFEGLKMGIPYEELQDFINLSARTAVAFDMAASEAGGSLGSLRAKLNMNTEAVAGLMDSVNFVADNFAAKGDMMIRIIERTSGTMATLNFPPQVIAGLAGFANQIEVTEQLAASGLNQMFAKMKQNPKLVKELMADPIAALNKQFLSFTKLDPTQRFSKIESEFGLEAARFVEKAINNVDLFNKTMTAAASNKAFGSMQREMDNRANRSSTVFERFKQTMINWGETIGDTIKPAANALWKFGTAAANVLKEFTRAHPAIAQFAAAAIGLVAAIALIAFPLGILIAMVGALATPIAAAIAGIIAIGAAFVYWFDSGNPVIEVITRIGSEVGKIIAPLAEMLGIGEKGADVFDLLFFALDKVGDALAIIMTPALALLRLLRMVVEAVSAVLKLDFSAAGRAVTSALPDLGDIASKGFNSVLNLVGMGEDTKKTAAAAASQKAPPPQSVDVNGRIQVEALPGSKIGSSNISLLPLGSNMSFIK